MPPRDLHPSRMGLSPLSFADWLAPRAGDAALLAERARLVKDKPGDVIGFLPESARAIFELAAILRDRGFALGSDPAPEAQLGAMAGAVAEDLLILTPPLPLRLTAGILCFPNRWRLSEKLGRALLAAHAPVPDYARDLAGPVDRFLERLRPGRAFTRANWGLASSPALHLPDPVTPVNPMRDEGYFRREEQSFIKLPESGAVIFAIRTTVVPWVDVAADERDAVRRMLAELSPEWHRYKSVIVE